MRLKDLMTKKPETVAAGASLTQAARKMREKDVGFLPIIEKDKLIGLVTDRDIAIRAVAEGRDPNKTKVCDVGTGEVISCFDDQDVDEAAFLMGERQIRRLVVVDHAQRPVGVLSLGDLANEPKETEAAKGVLEKVSKPGRPIGARRESDR